MNDTTLRIEPLPVTLIADGKTINTIAGTLTRPQDVPVQVVICISGVRHIAASSYVRLSDSGDYVHGFTSSFPISPGDLSAEVEVEVAWRRAGVERFLHSSCAVRSGEVPVHTPDDAPVLAICMATYRPKLELLRTQIESIKAQTFSGWRCYVQDDGSDAETLAEMQRIISDDSRFSLKVNPSNLGFYRNFEAAMRRVPKDTRYVALSDQDDRWHPTKLATLVSLLEATPQATLVYSDMRVVDTRGNLLVNTFALGRAARRDRVDSMLMANVVTGCSCLFRRSLLSSVLPFPSGGRIAFHDHWIACCAAAIGPVLYSPQPLSDYCQHGSNTLGYRPHQGLLLARVVAALGAAPAMWLTVFSPGLRRRYARVLGLLMNSAQEEYFVRQAFARTLANRGLVPADEDMYPSRRRASWLMRQAFRGRGYGIGYLAVALRLMTACVVHGGIRKIIMVRGNCGVL